MNPQDGRRGEGTITTKFQELENKWMRKMRQKEKSPKGSGFGSTSYLWKLRWRRSYNKEEPLKGYLRSCYCPRLDSSRLGDTGLSACCGTLLMTQFPWKRAVWMPRPQPWQTTPLSGHWWPELYPSDRQLEESPLGNIMDQGENITPRETLEISTWSFSN